MYATGTRFFRSGVALGALFCLAQMAAAQSGTTPVGAVTASIGDMAYEGETLDVASEGTATAEARFFGPVTSITIQAHDPQATSLMHNVLSVEVSLMGKDAAAARVDTTVSFWPEGMGAPFYISEDSGSTPEIAFETLSLDEGAAQARGSFSGVICRKDSFMAPSDTDDCMTVEGSFDTVLRLAD